MFELPVPDAVLKDDQSFELLRIFAKSQGQEFAINVRYENPAAWGILIADLVHHLSFAYEAKGHDPDEVFRSILEAFRAELETSTDFDDETSG